MAPTAVGPRVWPIPKAMVIAAIPLGHADGGELKRTKAVVDPTIAKKETPNTSAETVNSNTEWPSNGSAAPTALTPRMIAVESPPLSRANRRCHTQGVANALERSQKRHPTLG